MEKSSYNSKRIQKDDHLELDNVISLTVTNDGNTDLRLLVNGSEWEIPKRDDESKTKSHFNIPPDFTNSDIQFEFFFEGGLGNAIVAYKVLLIPKC